VLRDFEIFIYLFFFFMVKGFSLGLVKVLNKHIMGLDYSGLNSSKNFLVVVFGYKESARKTGKL